MKGLFDMLRQRSSLALTLSLCLVMAACASSGPLASVPPVTATDRVSVTQNEVGAVITAPDDILFESGRHDIKADASDFLVSLADTLNSKTGARILIEAHTDNSGAQGSSFALSDRRADALRRALVARHVVLSRITTVGLGSSQPIAKNDTASGRSLNRRVAIILIGESPDNLIRDGSMFRNVGNHLGAAASNIALSTRNLTTALGKSEQNLRSRYVGAVSHCPDRSGQSLIIIDGSNVTPNPVVAGQEIQHVVDAQLCMPAEAKRNIDQAVSVLQNGKQIFTSPSFVHNGMYRSKHQFFTVISIPAEAPRGMYEVESLVKLDGRTFRQSTPFEVR